MSKPWKTEVIQEGGNHALTIDKCIAIVMSEPELPGHMPSNLKCYEREELCRAVVRGTKNSILARLQELQNEGS